MKRILTLLLVFTIVLGTVPAYAAQKGSKGASATAYEHASDEAVFHRVGDWFATRGKSEEEKQAILAERKAKRAAKRAQKEAARQKKIAEKEARKAQKAMNKKMKGMKKGVGK
ncbi:MAG: hypothetical protein U9R44_00305 [Candidatus Omnitrophota bacterium]|nr:hypothetical protein [Candidatus Omnitrophota bacterium]